MPFVQQKRSAEHFVCGTSVLKILQRLWHTRGFPKKRQQCATEARVEISGAAEGRGRNTLQRPQLLEAVVVGGGSPVVAVASSATGTKDAPVAVEDMTASDILAKIHTAEVRLADVEKVRKEAVALPTDFVDEMLGAQVKMILDQSTNRGQEGLGEVRVKVALNSSPMWSHRWTGIAVQPLWYSGHYVAVVARVRNGEAFDVEVCDSLADYRVSEKKNAVAQLFVGLKTARIRFTRGKPQKANDCGFHAVSNIIRLVFRVPEWYISRSAGCAILKEVYSKRASAAREEWERFIANHAQSDEVVTVDEADEESAADIVADTVSDYTVQGSPETSSQHHEVKANAYFKKDGCLAGIDDCPSPPATTGDAEPPRQDRDRVLAPFRKGGCKTGDRFTVTWKTVDRQGSVNESGVWVGTVTRERVPGLPATIEYAAERCDKCGKWHAPEQKEKWNFPERGVQYEDITPTTSIPALHPRCDVEPIQAVEPKSTNVAFVASRTSLFEEARTWFIFRERPPQVTKFVYEKYSKAARSEILRLLFRIKFESAMGHYSGQTMGTAIVHIVLEMGTKAGWAPTTLARMLGTAKTAMQALPVFTSAADGIDVTQDPIFHAAITRAQKMAKAHVPSGPTPMTETDFRKAQEALRGSGGQVLLQAMWCLAARASDVRSLLREDVTLEDVTDRDQRCILITASYRDGKGVAFRGPYSAKTVAEGAVALSFKNKVLATPHGTHIFTEADQKAVAKAVKELGLECRSIRKMK